MFPPENGKTSRSPRPRPRFRVDLDRLCSAPCLTEAAERARAERLEVDFHVADRRGAAVRGMRASMPWWGYRRFGVMFTPDQAKAASELGARLSARAAGSGMANWTPEGFIGQLFKTAWDGHLPPAGRVSSRRRCGASRLICGPLFGDRAPRRSLPRGACSTFCYRSAAHFHRGLPHLVTGRSHKALRGATRRRRQGPGKPDMTVLLKPPRKPVPARTR